jgi:multimeric flavodoxin WrbA
MGGQVMAKEILVLMGSPRRGDNTDQLCDEFIRGALESGHHADKVYLKDKVIGGCLGCFVCQTNNGQCVQKDDMGEIYEKIGIADIIVFASPVYFYSWTSLMKTTVDRTVAVEAALKNKSFYLISTGAAPDEQFMAPMLESFRRYIGCFRAGGNHEGGYVFGLGTDKPGDIAGTPAMERAYSLGREI